MKIRYKDKINLSKEKLDVIREIQEIYLKNFSAYDEKISNLGKKQVIKRSYKAGNLFKTFETRDENFNIDDFKSNWVLNETKTLEDKLFNHTGFSFFVEYEGLQVAIHDSLRQLGNFDFCLDHKINLHYCEKCKEKFNVSEIGDEKND